MAEWTNAPVSKTGIPQGIEGSNPSLSAIFERETGLDGLVAFVLFNRYQRNGHEMVTNFFAGTQITLR